jgi:hypothetical protein
VTAVAKGSLRPLAKPEAGESSEGRRSPRHKYVQFLWFHCLEGSGAGLARTLDISEEGIGFISSHEIARNERVFVVLLTPFGRISSVARVMHSSLVAEGSFRIGVRLEIVPPTDKAAWVALVDEDKETG